MKNKPKHTAEQFDLPVSLKLTVKLTNHHARLWNAHKSSYSPVEISNGQLATALLQRGLASWANEKGLQ